MGDVITTVPTTDSLVHYSEVCQMRRGIEESPNEPRCRLTDRERQEVGCRYLDGTFQGGGGPTTHTPAGGLPQLRLSELHHQPSESPNWCH